MGVVDFGGNEKDMKLQWGVGKFGRYTEITVGIFVMF